MVEPLPEPAADAALDDAPERRSAEVSAAFHGERLDKAVVAIAPEFSRNHLQGLIEQGHVSVDGKTLLGASRKVLAGQRIDIELVPTADILAAVAAARRPGQVLVGFAAETDDGLDRARAKRERKGVDLIVLNDVSRPDIGFEVDDNEVVLVSADGAEPVAKASKREIAVAILDRVERLLR